MSAIWGAIHLKNGIISERVSACMREAFRKCKIDRYEEIKHHNVYMGCGLQYFVLEAEKEQMPYVGDGIFFDADVVLDNRSEICDMLGIKQEEGADYPDGKLLYEIYKRKGKKCLNDLLGAYTFVWYDAERQKIEIVLDAVGNRCLYYAKVGDIFYFSSLLEPLVQLSETVELNDKWFTDFLGADNVVVFHDTESTPFKNIYRIAPAQYICIHTDYSIEKEIYWNPFEDYEEYRFETDREYQEMYLELWNKAVKDTLRAQEHSILLSGGLDSNAVAAIAAPYLKEKGKQLYSYTAIPLEDYQVDNSGRFVDNESESVKKTAEYYGNIETTFLRMEDVEPWEKSKEEIRVLEFPYKSVQNSLWIEEAMRQAYEKGSRVLLTGSYGNISISYGGIAHYINALYREGKKNLLLEEILKFSRNKNISAQKVYKLIEKQQKEEYREPFNLSGDSYVNRELAKEAGTYKQLLQNDKRYWEENRDYKMAIKSNIDWIAMRQIGEMKTKQSLATGVLLRDPTGDKRVLEFCIRLPIFQYCRDGIDRRLVRVYMKDLLPEHIIQEKGLGRQSIDLKCRMAPHWTKIREAWLALYDKYADSKYVTVAYARQQLLDKEGIEAYEQFEIERHMFTIFVLQYEGYIREHYERIRRKEEVVKREEKRNSVISVVVYIHNDEKWLHECIKSVTEQTRQNLEIILVDDASEDGSVAICEQWAERDHRIKVIQQKDAGESFSYQQGINIATGTWISFLRGSDCISKNFYENLQQKAEENDVELIGYQVDTALKGQRIKLFYDKDILNQYMNEGRAEGLPKAVCSYLYRKDFIQELEASTNSVWNLNIMERAQKCMIVYQNHMLVRQRDTELKMDDMIAENRLKMELANKYFSKQVQDSAILNYYTDLIKLYCKQEKREYDNRKMLKKEWNMYRKNARKVIIEAEIGRKKKAGLYVSTYWMYSFSNHI